MVSINLDSNLCYAENSYEIDNFISKLAKEKVSDNCTNFYDYSSEENYFKRENLKLYLQKMKIINPKFLLIGEAPGFKGCRLSGIPFTSNYIISTQKFFRDFKKPSNQNKESTATIMWETLDKLNVCPLLWNVFPFHPYKEKNLNSNRKPKSVEIDYNLSFLYHILKMFYETNRVKIGAVGHVAEQLLNKKGIPCKYITHSSFGRKNKFVKDLNHFFKNN